MSRFLSPVTNLREAGCGRVRRLLDSYLAGELTVETNHEILEHLSGCGVCPTESDARERLRGTVRRLYAVEVEPRPGFEDEVRALVSRTKPPVFSRPSATVLLAAAAVVSVASLAGVVVSSRGRSRVAGSVAIPERSAVRFASLTQAKCTLEYEWPLEARPMKALEEQLRPALVPALRAAARALPGFFPVAAHLCSHDGHQPLHFVFRRTGDATKGGLVSVIALPRGAGAPPTEEIVAVEEAAGRRLALAATQDGGFDIVGAESGGWVLFLVTSRGRPETIDLARAALPAVAVALAP